MPEEFHLCAPCGTARIPLAKAICDECEKGIPECLISELRVTWAHRARFPDAAWQALAGVLLWHREPRADGGG